jgi:hypothetical protein
MAGFAELTLEQGATYTTTVTVNGTGYAVNNTITILGTDLGGTTPENDLILTVLTIDEDGGILTGTASGTPIGEENKYYFKVVNENQVEVYSDPNLKVAVSGQNFPYVGATTTTATMHSSTGISNLKISRTTKYIKAFHPCHCLQFQPS